MRQVTRGIAAAVLLAAAGAHPAGVEPPGSAGDHQSPKARRHRLLHVPELRTWTRRLRHAPRQLRSAAGRLRRAELLHAWIRDGVYEIHVDNNGDAREDLTFQFQFRTTSKNIAVPVGDKMVAIPAHQRRVASDRRRPTRPPQRRGKLHGQPRSWPRRTGLRQALTDAADGSATFKKPVDRIGDKSHQRRR